MDLPNRPSFREGAPVSLREIRRVSEQAGRVEHVGGGANGTEGILLPSPPEQPILARITERNPSFPSFHYSWKEVMPDEFGVNFVDKPGGLASTYGDYPAVEVNGNTHVPADPDTGAVAHLTLSATGVHWEFVYCCDGGAPTIVTDTISTDQDDYDPQGADWLRLDVTAPSVLTGITAGTPGQVLTITNTGTESLTLSHQDTGSLVGNRFSLPGSIDYVLPGGGSLTLIYDDTAGVWRIQSNDGTGGTVPDGAVITHQSGSVVIQEPGSTWTLGGSTETTGTLTVSGPLVQTPATTTLSTDQDDWVPTGGNPVQNLNLTTDVTLTGMTPPEDYAVITITNLPTSTGVLTIPHNDAGSTYVFDLPAGLPIYVAPGGSFTFAYDPAAGVWRPVTSNGTSGTVPPFSVWSWAPGAMIVGTLPLAASTTSGASANVPSGTAPTSPNAGDVYQDGSHLYAYLGGAWQQLDQQTGPGSAGAGWVKVATLTNVSFSDTGSTKTINIYNLGVKGFVHASAIKHSTAFTGGTLAAYSIEVGISGGTTTYFLGASDVWNAPSNSARAWSPTTHFSPGGDTITATARSTGDTLNHATQGTVEIWLLVSTLP